MKIETNMARWRKRRPFVRRKSKRGGKKGREREREKREFYRCVSRHPCRWPRWERLVDFDLWRSQRTRLRAPQPRRTPPIPRGRNSARPRSKRYRGVGCSTGNPRRRGTPPGWIFAEALHRSQPRISPRRWCKSGSRACSYGPEMVFLKRETSPHG